MEHSISLLRDDEVDWTQYDTCFLPQLESNPKIAKEALNNNALTQHLEHATAYRLMFFAAPAILLGSASLATITSGTLALWLLISATLACVFIAFYVVNKRKWRSHELFEKDLPYLAMGESGLLVARGFGYHHISWKLLNGLEPIDQNNFKGMMLIWKNPTLNKSHGWQATLNSVKDRSSTLKLFSHAPEREKILHLAQEHIKKAHKKN